VASSSDRASQAEVEWAHTYDGYRRLAGTPEQLTKLIQRARNSYASHRRVPNWCGVDFLRGWAFLLVREDRHHGAGSLGVEWEAVLDAVRRHPDALPADLPPDPSPSDQPRRPRAALPSTFSMEPRRHRDAAFLAAKRARWREPHIAPMNDFVDQIREQTGLDVPYLDPDSGGAQAKVLFLLEAPARAAAHDSGMLSADNDDGTAANIWRAYREAGMPRTLGLHWNIVPWYVGTNEKLGAIDQEQRQRGAPYVLRLLDLAPEVRVVIAFGNHAKRGAESLSAELSRRDVTVLTSVHPSQRNYNSMRERTTREVSAAFREAMTIVGDA